MGKPSDKTQVSAPSRPMKDPIPSIILYELEVAYTWTPLKEQQLVQYFSIR